MSIVKRLLNLWRSRRPLRCLLGMHRWATWAMVASTKRRRYQTEETISNEEKLVLLADWPKHHDDFNWACTRCDAVDLRAAKAELIRGRLG